MQEWPASAASSALDGSTAVGADAVIFVVDPTSPASIAYFRKWVEVVPDGTPTIVVAALHEEAGETPNKIGHDHLAALCSGDARIAALPPLPTPPPGTEGAGDAYPSAAVGLSLPVFRFWLKVSRTSLLVTP